MSTQPITHLTIQKPSVAPAPQHRLSTATLDLVDNVLKVAAGCAMYWFNPVETAKGALCGAGVRLMLSDDSPHQNDTASRANLTASICFTGMATAFAFSTPGPHAIIPIVLGFNASADGAFGILSKFTN